MIWSVVHFVITLGHFGAFVMPSRPYKTSDQYPLKVWNSGRSRFCSITAGYPKNKIVGVDIIMNVSATTVLLLKQGSLKSKINFYSHICANVFEFYYLIHYQAVFTILPSCVNNWPMDAHCLILLQLWL